MAALNLRHALGCCALLVAVGPPTACPATAATELRLYTRYFFVDDESGVALRLTGTLQRELARQSLLIAARDGLGMRTCDDTLREKPATPDPISLLLIVDCWINGDCQVLAFRRGPLEPGEPKPPADQAIWRRDYRYRADAIGTYLSLAPQFEAASRDSFIELLKSLGAERVAPTPAATQDGAAEGGGVAGNTPAVDVESLLTRVDAISHFVAIRELHRRLRRHENAADLAALVRGYANFALLSETSWGGATHAYKARSLIYAERLKALFADDPLTRPTVAYAHALGGLQHLALRSLRDQAKARAQARAAANDNDAAGNDAGDEPPGWAVLIRPYCLFDTDRLATIADLDGPHSRWAAYLRAWSIYNTREYRQIATVVRETIQDTPEAMNLYRMIVPSQLSTMRYAARVERSALLAGVPRRLLRTPSIPPAVRAICENPQASGSPGDFWRRLLAALDDEAAAGDQGWGALARVLEDIGVRAAANSLSVARGASTERDLTEHHRFWAPFVQDHPDAAYFRVAALLGSGQAEELKAACQDLRFRDPNRWMVDASRDTARLTNRWGQLIGKRLWRDACRDFTCQSLSVHIARYTSGSQTHRMLTREIREVSPRSPVAMVARIAKATAEVAEKPLPAKRLAGWERQARTSLAIWRSLGRAYQAIDKPEDAARCLNKSFQLSPEFRTLSTLAVLYERTGQQDKVVPTLERMLGVESFGLEHAQANDRIAKYYQRVGDPASAKPYAVAGEQSYAAWALITAATVCEELGDLGEADHWHRALSTSYPTSCATYWYLFRKRHGREDTAEPYRLAKAYAGKQPLASITEVEFVFRWLEGDLDYAREYVDYVCEAEPTPKRLSMGLLLAAETQDADAVAKFREKLVAYESPYEEDSSWLPRYKDLIVTLTGPGPIDAAQLGRDVEAFLRCPGEAALQKPNQWYPIGKLLQLKGYSRLAGRCYREATADVHHSATFWYLVAIEAHDYPAPVEPATGDAGDAANPDPRSDDKAEAAAGGDAAGEKPGDEPRE